MKLPAKLNQTRAVRQSGDGRPACLRWTHARTNGPASLIEALGRPCRGGPHYFGVEGVPAAAEPPDPSGGRAGGGPGPLRPLPHDHRVARAPQSGDGRPACPRWTRALTNGPAPTIEARGRTNHPRRAIQCVMAIFVCTLLCASADPVETRQPGLNDVNHLFEQCAELMRSSQRGGLQADPSQVLEIRRQVGRMLLHPPASLSGRGDWMLMVENAATLSFQQFPGDFDRSRHELGLWLGLIDRSRLGRRSERASVCARLWGRFHQWWSETAPEQVRESLNKSSTPGFVELAGSAHRRTARFAEAAVRNRLLDESGRWEEDDGALYREFGDYLQRGAGEETELLAIFAPHMARSMYAVEEPERALGWLGQRVWSCPRSLAAGFFICWHGTGDREAALRLVRHADRLVEEGLAEAGDPDLEAVWRAYYEGLVWTSDQLKNQARANRPLTMK